MKLLAINIPNLDLSYFDQRGFHFDVTHQTINQTYPLKIIGQVQAPDGIYNLNTPDVTSSIANISGYKVIMVGWNPNDYGEAVVHTGGYTFPTPLPNGTWYCTVRQDNPVNNTYPVHELHHVLCDIINVELGDHTPKDFMDSTPIGYPIVWKPYYINDPNSNDIHSNFNQTWKNIIPFLSKLNTIMPKYKYFKPSEIIGLQASLVSLLDKARDIAGVPFKITSGLRTSAQNASVGGVPNSAHLTGEAADISCTDSLARFKMLNAFLQVGFNRIEVCPDHIHVDVSRTLPQNVLVLSQNG